MSMDSHFTSGVVIGGWSVWRDKVIDIMLQSPDWDADNKMYWLGAGPTDNSSRLGKGAFERGDRIAITFHMGIWMDALWHAWLALDAEGDARAAPATYRYAKRPWLCAGGGGSLRLSRCDAIRSVDRRDGQEIGRQELHLGVLGLGL